MTDAQQLFDFARRQFNEIADDVERHFEHVAGQLREWIPADSRLIRTTPPKRLPPPSTFQLVQQWISRNRALSAALVAFVVTGSIGVYVYARNEKSRRKRRAKRSTSGARTDVVVIAGSISNPLISALYLDLERRGFIVYVVGNTTEDEHYIRSQSRVDLHPLTLDLVDPYQAQDQLARFQQILSRDHYAFDGAETHRLNLAGLVLAPETTSPPARIADISTEEWSDALNAKLLNTIATTNLFLPTILQHRAKILLLTSSVTPSLRPPLHSIESTIYHALHGFMSSLASELRPEGIDISHFKLGNIDVPSLTARHRREAALSSSLSSSSPSSPPSLSSLWWPFASSPSSTSTPRLRATPARKFHESVFDALVATNPPRTWYVGRGARTYDFIGTYLPAGFVGWMLNASARAKGSSSSTSTTTMTRRPDGSYEHSASTKMTSDGLQGGFGREDAMGESRVSMTWEKVDEHL